MSCDVSSNINKIFAPQFCAACQYGKSHRLSHTNLATKTKELLELFHLDLWGPAPIASGNSYRYYLSIVDDYSRFTWIYPLVTKSETFSTFQVFKKMIETQLEKKIKTLQIYWRG